MFELFFVLVVVFVFYVAFGVLNIGGAFILPAFNYAKHNPFEVLGYVGLYLMIGIIWSFVKWYLHQRELAEKARIRFESKNQTVTWEAWKKENYFPNNISDYYGELTFWITTWPVNIAFTLVFDIMKDIGRYVGRKLRLLYESVSKMAWR